MDEVKKISISAVASIAALAYGYSIGFITLTEYYIGFGITVPIILGYGIWNFFIRRAFSLHFQTEEGNHLREIGFVRIVPFDKDKSIYDYKKSGVLRQFWLDSRNT